MSMEFQIKPDEAALNAVNNLADAIRSINGGVAAAPAAEAKTTSASSKPSTPDDDKGPFFWRSRETSQFGKAASKAAYTKLKAKDDSVYRIDEHKYKELQEQSNKDKQANIEKAKAEDAADKAAAAKAEQKAAADAKKSNRDSLPKVTKEDLITLFTEYLPKDLDADERKERRGFVQALLERFGAAKVTEMAEEHWPIAAEAVRRKMDGEDIDPTQADWDSFIDEAADAGDDEGDDDNLV